jgi:Uncharacterized conserved protein (DUF2304)
MSQSTAQVIFAGILCAIFMFAIYVLARREHLSFQYAVGWLSLFAIGIVATVALPATNRLSSWIHVTPAALLALLVFSVLIMICIQLSISISGMQKQIRRLAEESAKLKLQIKIGSQNDAAE